jgi:hypothetical protein
MTACWGHGPFSETLRWRYTPQYPSCAVVCAASRGRRRTERRTWTRHAPQRMRRSRPCCQTITTPRPGRQLSDRLSPGSHRPAVLRRSFVLSLSWRRRSLRRSSGSGAIRVSQPSTFLTSCSWTGPTRSRPLRLRPRHALVHRAVTTTARRGPPTRPVARPPPPGHRPAADLACAELAFRHTPGNGGTRGSGWTAAVRKQRRGAGPARPTLLTPGRGPTSHSGGPSRGYRTSDWPAARPMRRSVFEVAPGIGNGWTRASAPGSGSAACAVGSARNTTDRSGAARSCSQLSVRRLHVTRGQRYRWPRRRSSRSGPNGRRRFTAAASSRASSPSSARANDIGRGGICCSLCCLGCSCWWRRRRDGHAPGDDAQGPPHRAGGPPSTAPHAPELTQAPPPPDGDADAGR